MTAGISHRVAQTSGLWMLAGCPYLFEPPDESNVPIADEVETDTDTDGDTDTDLDTETGTGTDSGTEPVSDGPIVETFQISPRMRNVVVYFHIDDPNGDIEGGSITMTDGTIEYTLAIPGEIFPVWNPDGLSAIELPTVLPLDCEVPLNQTWTVTATDAAGHESAPLEFELDIPAVGVFPEDGVPWPGGHLVSPFPPFTGCVEWELGSGGTTTEDTGTSVRDELANDYEGFIFTTPSAGDYVIQVDWDHANNDFEALFRLYYLPVQDVDGDGFADTIADSSFIDDVGAEVTIPATAGDQWLADLPFWEFDPGSTPPFRAMFLVTKE